MDNSDDFDQGTPPHGQGPESERPADPAAGALASSAPLFKANQFEEANDVLRKAIESDAQDARVWYDAALSQGQATGQWSGEPMQLVRKGVEYEQAGMPDTAAIADFPANLKKWVDFYRKQVKR